MGRRFDLDAKLRNILGSDNVYFQPPESIKMQYPCIVYSRAQNDTRFADNVPYSTMRKYSVIVIDRDPDSEIPDKIASLPLCRSGAFYRFDNLNHYPFTIYY